MVEDFVHKREARYEWCTHIYMFRKSFDAELAQLDLESAILFVVEKKQKVDMKTLVQLLGAVTEDEVDVKRTVGEMRNKRKINVDQDWLIAMAPAAVGP